MTALQRLLVTLIHSSGRTQRDLARASGMTEKHLSEILNGHQEGTLTAWQRLFDAAGVEIGERQ